MNGDTIKIGDGVLIDGQHRLLAVLKSGVPIKTLVARGIKKDAFDTIDVGRRRTGADTLAVDGEKNVALLAATVSIVERYKTGTVMHWSKYSNVEIRNLLARYPKARESAAFANKIDYRTKILPGSIISTVHFLVTEKHGKDSGVGAFFRKVVGGIGIESGTGEHLLNKRLIDNAMSQSRLDRGVLLALTIKAWNMSKAGKRGKKLQFKCGTSVKEDFPEVQ